MRYSGRDEAAQAALKISGCYVKCEQLSGRGIGLVTTKKVKKGTVLLKESPTVFMQTPGSESSSWVCANCMTSLGSLAAQFGRLGLPEGTTVPDVAGKSAEGADPVPCERCDEQWYCSKACRSADSLLHRAFCSENEAHRLASQEFRGFVQEKNHTIYLAGIMAAAAMVQQDRGGPPAAAPARFDLEYVCASWSAIVVLPLDIDPMEEARVRKQCKKDCHEGRRLLLKVGPTASCPFMPRGLLFPSCCGSVSFWMPLLDASLPITLSPSR